MKKAMTQPTAVLVDLDETILVFDSVSSEVWRRVCEEFAHRLDGLAQDKLLRTIGDHERWYWSDPARHRRGRLDFELAWRETTAGAFGRVGVSDPRLLAEVTASYAARRRGAIEPLPGAIDCLALLQQRGIKLGLVTNGAAGWQRAKIDRFGLARYFDCIAIEGELGAGKPDRRVFTHVLDQLGVAPEEAWMVGDHLEFDIGGAQTAGMFAVWVDSRGEGLPESSAVRPNQIVRTLAELADLVS